MPPGRPAKPAHLKIVEGRGHGRDSGGRLVPEVPGFERCVPTKPEHLTPVASELWDRIVPELARVGILKDGDGAALEFGCEAYSRWRAAKEQRVNEDLVIEGPHSRSANPLIGIEERAWKDYSLFSSKFGLTPSDEMKIAKEPGSSNAGKSDPFD